MIIMQGVMAELTESAQQATGARTGLRPLLLARSGQSLAAKMHHVTDCRRQPRAVLDFIGKAATFLLRSYWLRFSGK
jgi:hypothetical protein